MAGSVRRWFLPVDESASSAPARTRVLRQRSRPARCHRQVFVFADRRRFRTLYRRNRVFPNRKHHAERACSPICDNCRDRAFGPRRNRPSSSICRSARIRCRNSRRGIDLGYCSRLFEAMVAAGDTAGVAYVNRPFYVTLTAKATSSLGTTVRLTIARDRLPSAAFAL